MVFDGYASLTQNSPAASTVTLQPVGFITPPTGLVVTRLGVVGYEGDRSIGGDGFRLDATCIGDAANPPGTQPNCAGADFFNSTIGRNAVAFTAKSPNYDNQLGFDADLIEASNVLPNSASSATIVLTTSGEAYLPSVVTFATDIYSPVIEGNVIKTVSDINGNNYLPGDVVEYQIAMPPTPATTPRSTPLSSMRFP